MILDVAYLCGCAVRGERPDAYRVKSMDLPQVFRIAEMHLLTAAVSAALRSAGVEDREFVQAEAKAKRKNALLDADRNILSERLNESGIWYMPLKGSVLKDLYPVYGMRQMSDNDILIDPSRQADVRRIMEDIGFKTISYGKGAHDTYHKLPVSNFEIHSSLFDITSEKKIYEYYKNIEKKLVKGERYERQFSNDDFYIYMIAHEYKHFSKGGTGLRSLLDTYVFLRHFDETLDKEYVESELKKLRIDSFETDNRNLAFHLLDNKKLTENDEMLLDYITQSGAYGTQRIFVNNQIKRRGRLGYLVSRTFLPYRLMLYQFPVLEKIPVLLPVLWGVRIIKALYEKPERVRFQLAAFFLPVEDRKNDPVKR